MIPKIIHYCWFGGNEKPDIINKCIASWREKCPDYEIIEWNESNFDISINQYMKQAYDAKKWAFVTDFARLWIIYNYGGIYFDTDVELYKSIDPLLLYDMFVFFESNIEVNTGAAYGAVQFNPIVKAMIDEYEEKAFINDDGSLNLTPCPRYNTIAIRKQLPQLQIGGFDQVIDNNAFFSHGTYTKYMRHYGTATWTDHPNLNTEENKHIWKDTRLKRFLRNPKRLQRMDKYLPYKLYRLYIFFAYDFLEFPLSFFIKKLYKRIFK